MQTLVPKNCLIFSKIINENTDDNYLHEVEAVTLAETGVSFLVSIKANDSDKSRCKLTH